MGADDCGLAVVLVFDVLADLLDVGVFRCGGQCVFFYVGGEDGWFLAEEKEGAGDFSFFGREVEGDGRFAVVEVGGEFAEDGSFGGGDFVAAFGVFGAAGDAVLDGFQVGEDEFCGDGFYVADGVDGAGDVVDVRIVEAADDLDDGVDLADVAEEFVAQSFALGRALD